jgi:hypothetical protein
MTDRRTAVQGGPAAPPPERSSAQVWRLGARVILVQVAALILLWVIQAVFTGW